MAIFSPSSSSANSTRVTLFPLEEGMVQKVFDRSIFKREGKETKTERH